MTSILFICLVNMFRYFLQLWLYGNVHIHGSFKMFQGPIYCWEIIEQYNHLSYISFKVFPLCSYASLPATEEALEVILLKPFQFVRRILDYVSSITKAPSLQCWFQSTEQVKISCIRVGRVWMMLQCCHIAFRWEILDQNRPVCWSIVVKEKGTIGSPFFGAFSSYRIPKPTKDDNVRFFIHISNSYEL